MVRRKLVERAARHRRIAQPELFRNFIAQPALAKILPGSRRFGRLQKTPPEKIRRLRLDLIQALEPQMRSVVFFLLDLDTALFR